MEYYLVKKEKKEILHLQPHKWTWRKFSSVQWLSCLRLFVTPWTAALQASLSITNSRSLPKHMSIELVMPSSHLILCCPLVLLPSIFPSIRLFSNESALRMRWPKYWSFSFNISPSSEHSGLISLQCMGLWWVFSNTTVQKHQFFSTQLSLFIHTHCERLSVVKFYVWVLNFLAFWVILC